MWELNSHYVAQFGNLFVPENIFFLIYNILLDILALCGPCSEGIMLAYSIHKLYKAIYTVGPLQRCHTHTPFANTITLIAYMVLYNSVKTVR